MKRKVKISLIVISLSLFFALPLQAETMDTRIGELQFTSGYPTEETVQKLYDELDFQRAVQAYLWALPMASYGAMAEEKIRLGCGSSAVVVADKSAEQQHLVLTANQDTVYMSGVLDLRNGPMVMELPPGLLGTLNNIWQQPLCDLGGPFSPEQNRGGKFLILPPGYDGPMPDFHFHIVASDSNIVVFYLRAIPQTRDDFPKLVELIHTYKQYKLSEAKEPPQMKFISLSGKEADMLTHEGFAYFESLARYINENPPRSQDMAMLGMLETLGIAHGRPFEPDQRLREILTQAAEVGRAMAKTLAWQSRIPKDVLYAYPGKGIGNIYFSVIRHSRHRITWLLISAANTPLRPSVPQNPWLWPCRDRGLNISVSTWMRAVNGSAVSTPTKSIYPKMCRPTCSGPSQAMTTKPGP